MYLCVFAKYCRSVNSGVILLHVHQLLQHSLHSLIVTLQKTCLSSTDGAVNGPWTEHVHDIWTRHLPHFRVIHGGGGIIIPRTGFEEEPDTDNDGGLHGDLNELPIEKPANSDKATVEICKYNACNHLHVHVHES